jgi:DsbE subfamily thiol:disulfide oxidoreductase
VVHIFFNPLVPWIFFGAIIMVLGGVVSLTDRHHRVGAPLRRLKTTAILAAAPVAAAPVAAAATQAAKPAATARLVSLIPLAGFLVLGGFFAWRLHLVEEGITPNLIPSVMVNKPAPQFDLPPLMDGQANVASADFKGKVTLVSFFASWCIPCREEHPYLPLVTQAGIRLMGISYKDRPADARSWLAELGNPYTVIGADVYGRTGIDFGVYGVPESYLIDKNGVIRFKQTGPLTPDVIRDKIIPLAQKLSKEGSQK